MFLPGIQHSGALRVVEIEGRQGLRDFVKVPWRLYADDHEWVPPLILERLQHMSSRNPYFDHARCCLWIAYRNGRPVGRISAQIDELHLARYQDGTGFFGMLEAEDHAETFHALFHCAETWLRSQGMSRVRGPFNFSINQECGLLVDGFDTPPMIMMGHARPYYAGRIVGESYVPAKDLLAYRLPCAFETPRVMSSVLGRAKGRVQVRPLRSSRLREELETLREIFEDAWSGNWGFLPFTPAEFADLGQNLKLLVDDDFVQIAEIDGVPAAMSVLFPNVNEVIRDLNGRLLPFGWLKLLWRLKVRFPLTGRVPLMGIRKRYQDSARGMALAFLVIDALRGPALRRGMKEVELSWILQDNFRMRKILEAIGAVPSKRYRIYEKYLT